MKKNELRYCILGLFFAFWLVRMQANEPSDIIVPVMEKGDAGQLCTYLAADAELVILGKPVAAQQQCLELRRFFDANGIKRFAVIHKGTKESASFVIGVLETDGQNYRINMFVREMPDGVSIQQLRIEKDN